MFAIPVPPGPRASPLARRAGARPTASLPRTHGSTSRSPRAGRRWRKRPSTPPRSARSPPDAGCAVGTGSGDAPAVGEERHADDPGAAPIVFAQHLAALGIPDAHASIHTAGDEALAVRRERDAKGVRSLE